MTDEFIISTSGYDDIYSINTTAQHPFLTLEGKKRYGCPVHGEIGERWTNLDFSGVIEKSGKYITTTSKPICFECIREFINNTFTNLTEIIETKNE